MHELGQIQREMGRPECVDAYRESLDIALRIEDRSLAASSAFNLGNAYKDLPPLRDLDGAERQYRKCLDLAPGEDRFTRASGLAQLGSVAYERFKDARAAKKPRPEFDRHLRDALHLYLEALEMTPRDAVGQLAIAHNQLGLVYRDAGDFDRAMQHGIQSLRLEEGCGNFYGAARSRHNIAGTLLAASQLPDARRYADAALRGFQAYGAGAASEVQKTLELISAIVKAATP